MTEIQQLELRLRVIEDKLDRLLSVTLTNSELKGQDEFRDLIKFLTTPSEYRSTIKFLTNWTKKATKLTIADPYLFSFDRTKIHRTSSSYVDALIRTLPQNMSSLEVFHLPGPNRKIFSCIKKYCHQNGIRFVSYSTTEIHDRVWIKNEQEAILIGTSFGGIGNKLAFVLPLPTSDVLQFKQELQRITNTEGWIGVVSSSLPVSRRTYAAPGLGYSRLVFGGFCPLGRDFVGLVVVRSRPAGELRVGRLSSSDAATHG